MAGFDKDRISIALVGMDSLPSDGPHAPAVKRFTFEARLDKRAVNDPRSPGLSMTVTIADDFFDDVDVIEVARSRFHMILAAIAETTADWDRDEAWLKERRLERPR